MHKKKKSSSGTKLSARLFSKYTPQAVTVSDKPLEISIGPFQLIWEPPPWKMQITGLQDSYWKFREVMESRTRTRALFTH